jgi:hypothetical protein
MLALTSVVQERTPRRVSCETHRSAVLENGVHRSFVSAREKNGGAGDSTLEYGAATTGALPLRGR